MRPLFHSLLHPLRSALLLGGCALTLGGAALAQRPDFPTRIYVSEMPKAERDAANENFSPALVVGPQGENGARRGRWRSETIGQPVTVEGIALGEPPPQESHMTTQRVAYEGGRIFVRGVDFRKGNAVGRLVRVKGTLEHSPEGVASFGPRDVKIDQHFYIRAESVEVLERTTDPVLMAPGLK